MGRQKWYFVFLAVLPGILWKSSVSGSPFHSYRFHRDTATNTDPSIGIGYVEDIWKIMMKMKNVYLNKLLPAQLEVEGALRSSIIPKTSKFLRIENFFNESEPQSHHKKIVKEYPLLKEAVTNGFPPETANITEDFIKAINFTSSDQHNHLINLRVGFMRLDERGEDLKREKKVKEYMTILGKTAICCRLGFYEIKNKLEKLIQWLTKEMKPSEKELKGWRRVMEGIVMKDENDMVLLEDDGLKKTLKFVGLTVENLNKSLDCDGFMAEGMMQGSPQEKQNAAKPTASTAPKPMSKGAGAELNGDLEDLEKVYKLLVSMMGEVEEEKKKFDKEAGLEPQDNAGGDDELDGMTEELEGLEDELKKLLGESNNKLVKLAGKVLGLCEKFIRLAERLEVLGKRLLNDREELVEKEKLTKSLKGRLDGFAQSLEKMGGILGDVVGKLNRIGKKCEHLAAKQEEEGDKKLLIDVGGKIVNSAGKIKFKGEIVKDLGLSIQKVKESGKVDKDMATAEKPTTEKTTDEKMTTEKLTTEKTTTMIKPTTTPKQKANEVNEPGPELDELKGNLADLEKVYQLLLSMIGEVEKEEKKFDKEAGLRESQDNTGDDELDDLEKELDGMNGELDDLEEELKKLLGESNNPLVKLAGKVFELSEKISRLAIRLEVLGKRLLKSGKELVENEKLTTNLKGRLDGMVQSLEKVAGMLEDVAEKLNTTGKKIEHLAGKQGEEGDRKALKEIGKRIIASSEKIKAKGGSGKNLERKIQGLKESLKVDTTETLTSSEKPTINHKTTTTDKPTTTEKVTSSKKPATTEKVTSSEKLATTEKVTSTTEPTATPKPKPQGDNDIEKDLNAMYGDLSELLKFFAEIGNALLDLQKAVEEVEEGDTGNVVHAKGKIPTEINGLKKGFAKRVEEAADLQKELERTKPDKFEGHGGKLFLEWGLKLEELSKKLLEMAVKLEKLGKEILKIVKNLKDAKKLKKELVPMFVIMAHKYEDVGQSLADASVPIAGLGQKIGEICERIEDVKPELPDLAERIVDYGLQVAEKGQVNADLGERMPMGADEDNGNVAKEVGKKVEELKESIKKEKDKNEGNKDVDQDNAKDLGKFLEDIKAMAKDLTKVVEDMGDLRKEQDWIEKEGDHKVIGGDKGKIPDELEDLQKDMRKLNDELKDLVGVTENLSVKPESIQKEKCKSLVEIATRLEKLATKILKLAGKIEELSGRILRLGEKLKENKKLTQAIKMKLAEMGRTVEDMGKRVEIMGNRLLNMEDKLNAITKRTPECQGGELGQLADSLKKLGDETKDKGGDIVEIGKKLQELSKEPDEVIDPNEKEKQKLMDDLAAMEEDLKKIRDALAEILEKEKELEGDAGETIEDKGVLPDKMEDMVKGVDKLRKDVKELQIELGSTPANEGKPLEAFGGKLDHFAGRLKGLCDDLIDLGKRLLGNAENLVDKGPRTKPVKKKLKDMGVRLEFVGDRLGNTARRMEGAGDRLAAMGTRIPESKKALHDLGKKVKRKGEEIKSKADEVKELGIKLQNLADKMPVGDERQEVLKDLDLILKELGELQKDLPIMKKAMAGVEKDQKQLENGDNGGDIPDKGTIPDKLLDLEKELGKLIGKTADVEKDGKSIREGGKDKPLEELSKMFDHFGKKLEELAKLVLHFAGETETAGEKMLKNAKEMKNASPETKKLLRNQGRLLEDVGKRAEGGGSKFLEMGKRLGDIGARLSDQDVGKEGEVVKDDGGDIKSKGARIAEIGRALGALGAEGGEIGVEGVNGAVPRGPWLKDAPKISVNDSLKIEQFPLKDNWVILKQKFNWVDAYTACNINDMHLAVLPTRKLAERLVESIYEKSASGSEIDNAPPKTYEIGASRRYWIGLTDMVTEGKWVWIGLGIQLNYNFWYPGQPSHGPETNKTEWIKREHCGSLWNPIYYGEKRNRHSFNDAQCSSKYYVICDKTKDLQDLLKNKSH